MDDEDVVDDGKSAAEAAEEVYGDEKRERWQSRDTATSRRVSCGLGGNGGSDDDKEDDEEEDEEDKATSASPESSSSLSSDDDAAAEVAPK